MQLSCDRASRRLLIRYLLFSLFFFFVSFAAATALFCQLWRKGEAIAIPWLFASHCYSHQLTRCPTPSAGDLIQGTRRRNYGDPACKEGGMEEGESGKRNTIAAAGNLSRPAPPPEFKNRLPNGTGLLLHLLSSGRLTFTPQTGPRKLSRS